MKKESVGDITRSGGFSRLVRDVEVSGEPTIIMKNNQPVVVVFPCPPGMERYLHDSLSLARVYADMVKEDLQADAFDLLLRQVSLGEFSKTFLLVLGMDMSDVNTAAVTINSGMAGIARDYITKYAVERPMKNSAQDTALSRNDNRSGAVSEVKQEELPLGGDSSLSRKRGRPKKASSPPKR